MPTSSSKSFFTKLAFSVAYLLTLPQAFTQTAPTKLAQHLHTLAPMIDGKLAYETVAVLQKYWRHAGNQDFNLCMDYLASKLRAGGYVEGDPRFRLIVKDTLLEKEKAWQPFEAELRLVAPRDTLLHSLASAKMTLCINSHATPPRGVIGEIVFVDTLANIAPASLQGKIAYTHASPQRYFESAVVQGGALGLLSSYLPAYNRAAEHPASISMSAIPYRDTPRAFGFKLSYGSQMLLDTLLQQGPVRAQVKVLAQFSPKLVREVIAEIVGDEKPEEKIMLLAHVDEPAANDNASGSGTLVEMALALREAMHSGKIAPPGRTVRMMWLEEITAVLRWQKSAPHAFEQVKAAFALDMVGEDVSKTGGTFLLEKFPDPSAIWTRPPEAHTEWGKGNVSVEQVRGNYLNDLVLAACELRARQTPWAVKMNPYEGGSDHVPFVNAGIPAVLAWHFTDVYYHTSGDELDKVSPLEMANVGISLSAAALLLADCHDAEAREVLRWLEHRAAWRMENESNNSREALRGAQDQSSALREEEKILRAWEKWYHEAFASVTTLPVAKPAEALLQAVKKAQRGLNKLADKNLQLLRK
ncbi:MAG: M28 family peptidase [candidate division KSB1 bacterium]